MGNIDVESAEGPPEKATGYSWVDPMTIPLPEALGALREILDSLELESAYSRTAAVCLLVHAAFYQGTSPIYVGHVDRLAQIAAKIRRTTVDLGYSDQWVTGLGYVHKTPPGPRVIQKRSLTQRMNGADGEAIRGVKRQLKRFDEVCKEFEGCPTTLRMISCSPKILSLLPSSDVVSIYRAYGGRPQRQKRFPSVRSDLQDSSIWAGWSHAEIRLAQDTTGRSLAVLLRALQYINVQTPEDAAATREHLRSLGQLLFDSAEIEGMPEWSAMARRVSYYMITPWRAGALS